MVSDLIYVSMPYSSPDEKTVEDRMTVFLALMGLFASRGEMVVSPLWFHYTLKLTPALGNDWAFWRGYSEALLARCRKLRVIKLPGWEQSSGVTGEIEFAEANGIEIERLTVEEATSRGR